MSHMPPMCVVVPMSGWGPVPATPNPVIVTPSPTAPDPDVTWGGTQGHGLDHWSRHGRFDTNRGRRAHDDRSRNRYSKIDPHVNTSICMNCGESDSGESYNCKSLFHNHYPFDAAAERNFVTTALRFCNAIPLWSPTEPKGRKPLSDYESNETAAPT